MLAVCCRHHAQAVLLLQELMPLLAPGNGESLQAAGLERHKYYLGLIADALRGLQAQSAGSILAEEAAGGTECFCWKALKPASAVVLTLAMRLLQHVPVSEMSQVWHDGCCCYA